MDISLNADMQAIDRIPALLMTTDNPSFTEVYGFAGTQGLTVLEGQRLVPRHRDSQTLFMLMHPSATLQHLPVAQAMAAAGLHVLCAGSRYPKNDSALVMEKVALDMGTWIRWAKDECGYEFVVLVGWSGGGSLSLFYQAEAEQPTITKTPAGDPVDLRNAGLHAADGLVFIAAHLSRAELLTEWLDPSVRNELSPEDRDLELDIYDEHCPSKPCFSADFVEHFRKRQIERNRRITAWCQEQLDERRRKPSLGVERAFVVHRTMCDPRWIDLTIDTNDRRENWCYLGDPRVANVVPAGLARYTSLRSWLSQWSYDLSNVRSALNAPRIARTPILQIENSADDAVPATHNLKVRSLLTTTDKEYVVLQGATHYYVNQPDMLARCISTIADWARRRRLLGDQ